MPRRTNPQLPLFAPPKRRARKVARRKPGRKPRTERVGFIPHVARPLHDRRHPVHVSIRRVRLAPSFRTQRVHAAIVGQLARAKRRGVRVVHYSVQHNHIHLMIEGEDRADLAHQMRLLFSGIAMAVNAIAMRCGSLFRDRHHRHELTTPTETRNALVYILFNARKHDTADGVFPSYILDWVDECSSAAWFQDWDPSASPSPDLLTKRRAEHPDGAPVTTPETWLARAGWRRAGGPLRLQEMPRGA